MWTIESSISSALLIALCSAWLACGGRVDDAAQAGSADAVSMVGQEAMVRLQADSTIYGIGVTVLTRDGARRPALFQGPRRLAEAATGGTFEFAKDSLPPRVRLLGSGEELLLWER